MHSFHLVEGRASETTEKAVVVLLSLADESELVDTAYSIYISVPGRSYNVFLD